MPVFKRLLVLLIGLGLIGGGAWWLLYLFVLRPVVHVPDDASVQSVTIYSAGGAVVRQSPSARSFRLGSGTYDVALKMASGAVMARSYHLGLMQSADVPLPAGAGGMAGPKTAQLVGNVSGLQPTPAGSGLTYLDTTSQTYSNLGPDGTMTALFPGSTPGINSPESGNQISRVSPLPGGSAILVTQNNSLYYWTGSAAQPLNMDGIDTSNILQQIVLVGSNSTNNDFVVSVAGTIYYYSSPGNAPQPVATIKNAFNQLAYGGGKFVAYDTGEPYATTNIDAAYAKRNLLYPALADIKTKKALRLANTALVGASVSPDGRKLWAKYRGDNQAAIYDISGGRPQQLKKLIRSDNGPAVWLSDGHLIYSFAGSIWHYDTGSDWSMALTSGLDLPPSSLAPQADGSLYFTGLTSGGQGALYRLGGNSSLSAADNKALLNILYNRPFNTTSFTAMYANITGPTFNLSLTYPPSGNNPTETEAVGQFKHYLLQAGLDPTKFTITAAYPSVR